MSTQGKQAGSPAPIVRKTRSFARNARGSVGVIFAFSLVPMIGLVGLGIDFGRTMAAKATLDAAADAAALAAATQAEATLQSAYGNGPTGIAAAQYAGQVAGTNVFNANAVKVGGQIGGAPTPQVVLTVNGTIISATASYATTVPTVFGQLFGLSAMGISDSAKSSLTLPAYLNISVAIDISQSMGLASTQTGMTQLMALTPDQCAFGCHVPAVGSAPGSLSYEKIAHNAGIQLRIDVIQQATQQMITTAQNLQGSSGMISFGLYTLQGGPGTPFGILSASSTNYTALKTAANNIDLGNNTSAGIGDTDYVDSMPLLTAAVPSSGTGATASTAQQFVFLMTDGVQDVAGSCTDGHCTQAFNPNQCAALKAKGVTVGVIYTTYLQMTGDPRFNDLVQSFWSTIPTNLQSCASPGWFYQASDAADIQLAMNALFAKATSRGVLTQ